MDVISETCNGRELKGIIGTEDLSHNKALHICAPDAVRETLSGRLLRAVF